MTPSCTLTADRGDAGTRLDLVLRRHLHGIASATRTRVQTWIDAGQVTVNGGVVRRPAARAALGDVIVVALPVTGRAPAAAEDVPLDVLYEDEHMLAINKPAGMVVHPTYRNTEGTALNALLWRAREWPEPRRPSLVGRLDKLTSGVLVVAKTPDIHAALQRAMMSAVAEKDYLAVVHGRVNTARGEIDLRLSRDRQDRRRVVASMTEGAPSLTQFERLARARAGGPAVSLLRCRLVTGRTHQIRVHLAARGWPIVGDPAYGKLQTAGDAVPAAAAILRTFPRQALHAWRVAFTHPVTGERCSISAPVPEDLEGLLASCGFSRIPTR